MYDQYGEQVEFYVVYVREAHPTDGWSLSINTKQNIDYKQPKTYKDRKGIAAQMCHELKISIPTLIDGLDDKTGGDYTAFPDRLYLVGTDGTISYKGRPGPFGFKPKELVEAIENELTSDTKVQ